MQKERKLTPEQLERLKKTMQIPIADKLKWIEEMLKLNDLYATKEIKEMQKKVREKQG